MFIANDITGNRVCIWDADKTMSYFCPVCGSSVIQRRGAVKVHHFAHKSGSECPFGYSMTDWHLGWQAQFPEECREVVFANESGEVRRADVFVNNVVIEFQHSKISHDEIASRTKFHHSAGRHVWWVFDYRNKDINDVMDIKLVDVYSDGISIGNRYLSRHIMSLLHHDDVLVLDYGCCCLMLSDFNWLHEPDVFAEVGYLFPRDVVCDIAKRSDIFKSTNIYDDDMNWLQKFVESNLFVYAPIVKSIVDVISSDVVFTTEIYDKLQKWVAYTGCLEGFHYLNETLYNEFRPLFFYGSLNNVRAFSTHQQAFDHVMDLFDKYAWDRYLSRRFMFDVKDSAFCQLSLFQICYGLLNSGRLKTVK